MNIVGNDVSEYQGQIDWDTYKNNANFCIIRATYGNGYVDKQYFRNRDEVRRVGLPHGFYHYAYPQYNSPVDEANWMISQIDIKDGELLALDFEEQYTGDVVMWCKDFLDHISQHLNGYKPLIYLNQSQTQGYNWQPLVTEGYGLWLASYNPDGMGQTGAWPFMAMQQTTSSQQVPGIVGNVDRDVFFGDVANFTKYGYSSPVPTPSPIPPPPPTMPPDGTTTPPPTTTPPGVDYKSYLVRIKAAMAHGWFWQKLSAVRSIIAESGV